MATEERLALESSGVAIRAFAAGAPRAARDHAKYLVADDLRFAVLTENLVASAFRSETPNTGYGLVGESSGLARDLGRLFDWDWALAGGPPPATPRDRSPASGPTPQGPPAGSVVASLLASPGEAALTDAWTALVGNATATVQVESLSADDAVLGPDRPLGEALLRAASRGVTVSVLLGSPADAQASPPQEQPAARLAAAALSVAAPLEVRIDPRLPMAPSKMHAKVLVVDATRYILGSHNLVEAAFVANREVSLLVHDPATASWLADQLGEDFDRVAPATAVLAPDVSDGQTLGHVTVGDALGPTLPLASAVLLLGGAVALVWSVRPRGGRRSREGRWPWRGRPLGRAASGGSSQGDGDRPEQSAAPGAFELRVTAVDAPEPSEPGPDAGLPPSALDRLRER